MKPKIAPLPEDLRALVLEIMREAKFPMLATLDGDQARVRPVSPVRTDGFTVYVASLRSSHKTGEIEQNQKVELCYLDDHHDQVRITGRAERVTDRAFIDELFASYPLLRTYLGSPDNPEFMLYRIVPSRVRFMREWALEYHEISVDEPGAIRTQG
jgi:general stress protein 26